MIEQNTNWLVNGSWLFNLDLLGYGLLAISTFFVGLSLDVNKKNGKRLKLLLLFHGVFFVCMIFPVLPIKATNEGMGGIIALLCWCLFFLPIGISSILHFKNLPESYEKEESRIA